MEGVIKRYREKGLKITPQRLAIIEFLDGNTDHPTAEDIYREIKKKHPTVSFATVYNTIQALKERGEIMEVTIDPGRKRIDPNPAPHHHIICTQCSRVSDVFVDYSGVLRLPEEVQKSFRVTGNHVDFFGVCRDCAESDE